MTEPAPQVPDYASSLNPQQWAAVSHRGGPLLVVAGAGTGKTRVIAHRIAYLAAHGLARSRAILALTFTNRAADEMRDRASALLGQDVPTPWVGTIHAAGYRILRRHHRRAGLAPNFTVLTPRAALTALRHALVELGSTAAAVSPYDARSALTAWYAGRPSPLHEQLDVPALAAHYRRLLIRANSVDIEGLITETSRLLHMHDDVRLQVHAAIDHVLVDEYQDTSVAQSRLLHLLAGPDMRITAVGDDDQAIYGWRFADVANILRFSEDFPGATVVRLEQNYRSTRRILRAGNALLAHNRQRLGKTLDSALPAGMPVTVASVGDEIEEAGYVADVVTALLADGRSHGDIAVLYRTNAQSRALEEALAHAGLPYQIRAGGRFYERPEVARVVAGLKLTCAPDDEAAWRALLPHVRGFGNRLAQRSVDEAAAQGTSLATLARTGELPVPAATAARVARLCVALAEAAKITDHSIRVQRVAELWDEVGTPVAADTFEREVVQANLAELTDAISQFVRQERRGLGAFLQRLALAQVGRDESGVQLMTLHAAKGLEFEAVLVTGVEEGLLPHRRALAAEADVEEERRLLYVGMTRARRVLYLTYAHARSLAGQCSMNRPSRFLDEIPPQLLTRGRRPTGATPTRLLRVDPGDRVSHARWGDGVVTTVDGPGVAATIVIHFDDGAERRVPLCHTPLRHIGKENNP